MALRPEQDGSTEIFRLGSGQALWAFARRSPRSRPQDGSSYNLFLPTNSKTAPKGRVFLLDTMSFIFRAYHAMSRQRPMSTKTGVPTAATYVFVNMLRKLRADFQPEYLAAVFDVAGPTFRDEQAKAVTSVRKFDIKTQTFQEIAYHGYNIAFPSWSWIASRPTT